MDYPRWADYIEKHFALRNNRVERVLDLACGTGSLTLELCRRGYTLMGVDLAPEMLAVADAKCREAGFAPRFFCQGMEALRLPERVDACVCCLDSVNYVLKPQKLRRTFRRVYDCLEPGGVFLFDVNTPERLWGLFGELFLDERVDVFCAWR